MDGDVVDAGAAVQRALGGLGAEGISLSDDTGALDVLCPVDIRGHAAILSKRGPFGVEVIAQHQSAPRPPVDWYALATPSDRGASGFGRLLEHEPPDATATIIHPPA